MKLFRYLLSAILLLVLLGSTASLVMAASLTVTKTADTNDGVCNSDCSLREAIAAASPGDTITFDPALAGQTVHLASSLLIDKDLTVDGSNLTPHIEISGDTNNDGTGEVAVLEIAAGSTVELNGLDIIKGYSVYQGPMISGGITNRGILTIVNSTISENTSNAGDGGGIYNDGILTLTGSTLDNNSAAEGGAILNGPNSTLTITSSIFSNNFGVTVGELAGGAGAIGNIGTLSITNSVFINNSAPAGAGAIVNSFQGTTTITNSNFWNNSTAGPGGAIYHIDGILLSFEY